MKLTMCPHSHGDPTRYFSPWTIHFDDTRGMRKRHEDARCRPAWISLRLLSKRLPTQVGRGVETTARRLGDQADLDELGEGSQDDGTRMQGREQCGTDRSPRLTSETCARESAQAAVVISRRLERRRRAQPRGRRNNSMSLICGRSSKLIRHESSEPGVHLQQSRRLV